MTQAGKVAEIFSTAGEAFSKLGSLAMALQPSGERSQDGGKWGDEEIEMLRKAVSQFGNDIEKISELVRTKSANQIKAALKQKATQNITPKVTPGSIITTQLSKSPLKMNQSVVRMLGQKAKAPVTSQIIKKVKIDTSLTSLTPIAPKKMTLQQIPTVLSTIPAQGFQVILPQQQVKTTPMAVMQTNIVQKMADANTSGNVDVET